MSAYIVALIDIHDPDKYQAYTDSFDIGSFQSEYGGEILIVSDEPEVVEGEWSGRLVLLRFPSQTQARGWYESAEYRDVRKIRWAHSKSDLTLHLGVDEAPVPATAD
jgi:uncharacterized protein (DUF1330 family)